MSDSIDTSDQRAVRFQKLEALRAAGRDPFRGNWPQTHTSAVVQTLHQAREAAFFAANPEAVAQLKAHQEAQTVVDGERAEFRAKMQAGEVEKGTRFTPSIEVPPAPEIPEGESVSVAGRVVMFNDMGKASFVKLLDGAGKIQVYATRDALGDEEYKQFFKKLDLGDFVGVRGPTFRTKTGEITIKAEAYALVGKSLRPLPEKFHGMTDAEQIYRQRYLDLISNDASRLRFQLRSAIIRAIREFLWGRDFVEVETPCLHSIAGGAAARPFVTHFNALDCDFYLRIALELHLKRMLVGGFDRVFELGRVFRNEGLSRRHNPEFTMLELYQAYTDHRGMMELVRGLLHDICDNVLGTRQIPLHDSDEVIDLDGEWREAQYRDLVIEAAGDPEWFSRDKDEKLARCAALGIQVDPELGPYEIDNDVFEKLVEPKLIQPTFVTRIPRELCPLAKLNESGDGTLDVFELCINGQEIAPAYSEQNDP
ncbi:MAG: lysine--tRNA ligase, partial [Opitutales bacterium]